MLLTTTLLVDKVKEDVTEINGPLLESIADIVTVVVDAGGCGRLRCSRNQRGGIGWERGRGRHRCGRTVAGGGIVAGIDACK
jgi:hypothetical protein